MQEFLPIASGLILGGLLAATSVSRLLRITLILLLAAAATIGSGEFRLSWSYLVPDIVEVASAAVIAWFAVRLWRRRNAARNTRAPV